MTKHLGNVLITGASSGIGAATAKLLAQSGYRVWGTTRKPEAMAESAATAAVTTSAAPIRFIQLDTTDDQSVRHCIAHVLDEAGQIDVLINNAGYGIYGAIEEVPIEMAKAQFETNVFGVLRVIQAVLPAMRERRSGTIINVGSLAGKLVIPFQTHYSASKHALEAFTEGLRQEVRPFGIRVALIEPGDIKTNFNNATQFPDVTGSPYQRWTESSWNAIDINMQKAPPPDVVARMILRVLNSRKPRTRYPAGDLFSRRFPLIRRLLPDRLAEWAVRMFYGINFR